MPRSVLRWLAMGGFVLWLTGCGFFKRVSECRRLAQDVNGALDSISEARDAGGDTAATYRDVAVRYEQLSKQVGAFSTGSTALARNLQEYSAFFSETSRTVQSLAAALEKNDAVSVGRLRRDMANLARREKTLVARIDGACSGP